MVKAPRELTAVQDFWPQLCAASQLTDDLAGNLADYARGVALDQLSGLAALFGADGGPAERLTAGFVSLLAASLTFDPNPELTDSQVVDPVSGNYASLPLRSFANDHFATLVLLRSESAVLSLQTLRGGRFADPVRVVFGSTESRERVMAGRADAVIHRRSAGAGGAALAAEPENAMPLTESLVTLEPGTCWQRDGRYQAMTILRAESALLVLKLQRSLPGGACAQEVERSSGAIVRQAAGSMADTRLEIAAKVLGAMERRDAAPVLAAAALAESGHAADRGSTGGIAGRWQALRQCLALDSRIGLFALTELSGRIGDPLAPAARRLQGQLVITHPALFAEAPCR